MAITEPYSGTETIGTTEWSLTTDTAGPDVQTDDGVYQVFLDLAAVAAGDVFRLRVYERVLAAGTQRVVYEATFAGPVIEPIIATPSLILLHGWDVTLTRIAGTDRSVDFSVRRVA